LDQIYIFFKLDVYSVCLVKLIPTMEDEL